MIDWDLAISTGVRWARPGPQVSLAEAKAVVAELHGLAAAVAEPVQEVTGMFSAEETGQVAVVDRPGWIRANIDGFRVVLDPLVEHLCAAHNSTVRLANTSWERGAPLSGRTSAVRAG